MHFMIEYLVRTAYMYLVKQEVPPETVRFSEQIMSADKYLSIFSRQMEAIVYVQAHITDGGGGGGVGGLLFWRGD